MGVFILGTTTAKHVYMLDNVNHRIMFKNIDNQLPGACAIFAGPTNCAAGATSDGAADVVNFQTLHAITGIIVTSPRIFVSQVDPIGPSTMLIRIDGDAATPIGSRVVSVEMSATTFGGKPITSMTTASVGGVPKVFGAIGSQVYSLPTTLSGLATPTLLFGGNFFFLLFFLFWLLSSRAHSVPVHLFILASCLALWMHIL